MSVNPLGRNGDYHNPAFLEAQQGESNQALLDSQNNHKKMKSSSQDKQEGLSQTDAVSQLVDLYEEIHDNSEKEVSSISKDEQKGLSQTDAVSQLVDLDEEIHDNSEKEVSSISKDEQKGLSQTDAVSQLVDLDEEIHDNSEKEISSISKDVNEQNMQIIEDNLQIHENNIIYYGRRQVSGYTIELSFDFDQKRFCVTLQKGECIFPRLDEGVDNDCASLTILNSPSNIEKLSHEEITNRTKKAKYLIDENQNPIRILIAFEPIETQNKSHKIAAINNRADSLPILSSPDCSTSHDITLQNELVLKLNQTQGIVKLFMEKYKNPIYFEPSQDCYYYSPAVSPKELTDFGGKYFSLDDYVAIGLVKQIAKPNVHKRGWPEQNCTILYFTKKEDQIKYEAGDKSRVAEYFGYYDSISERMNRQNRTRSLVVNELEKKYAEWNFESFAIITEPQLLSMHYSPEDARATHNIFLYHKKIEVSSVIHIEEIVEKESAESSSGDY